MNILASWMLIAACSVSAAAAQDSKQLNALVEQHVGPSFDEFRDMLRVPNDANFPEHVTRNVEWIHKAFTKRGFQFEKLATQGAPLGLARYGANPADPTVLIYMQVDGQPVDPSRWSQEDPYEPELRCCPGFAGYVGLPWKKLKGERDPEWRIFARAAADAKGPIAMFLSAWDIARKKGLLPGYNVKIVFDFEEELGSPHLAAGVTRHRAALAADMLVIADGPRHYTNRPTLTFGARGIMTLTLTVHGPERPVHSGHYGNYVPNPAFRLARLLSTMKGPDGRVSIDGFYDGIQLSERLKEELARVPDDEKQIRDGLGILNSEKVAPTLQQSLQYPSLNVRGMASAWVGKQRRTIIPSEAIAEIDVRLVKESDPQRLIGLIEGHIRAQGYHLLDREPGPFERRRHDKVATLTYRELYGAFRTQLDSRLGDWLRRCVVRGLGEEPVMLRTSGGSVPISPFVNTLGVPAVSLALVNPDNNQHSPNENLRVGNYEEGVVLFLSMFVEPIDR